MNNYHDYVIKDGRFVGHFEEMYRDCDDPWNQKKDVINSYSKMCAMTSIARINADNVLEIGCGLGYYTNFLHLMFPTIHFVGMDISETAISKAKQQFPEVDFFQGEVKTIDVALNEAKKSRWGGMGL